MSVVSFRELGNIHSSSYQICGVGGRAYKKLPKTYFLCLWVQEEEEDALALGPGQRELH